MIAKLRDCYQQNYYFLSWQFGNHYAVPTKDSTALTGSCFSGSHVKHSGLTEVPILDWLHVYGYCVGIHPGGFIKQEIYVSVLHLFSIWKFTRISRNLQNLKTTAPDNPQICNIWKSTNPQNWINEELTNVILYHRLTSIRWHKRLSLGRKELWGSSGKI